jgi:hypothetical protein
MKISRGSTISSLVIQKHGESINEGSPREWVSSNTNDKALAEPNLSGLVDSLIGEGTRTGDDSNSSTLVDKARHNANFTLSG